MCSGSLSKFPVVLAKVFSTKIYGPLPSMLLLPTDCLSLDLLQDGPRIDLRCFVHELAVEISCCAQYVTDPNDLLAPFTKIRHLDRSTDL